MINFLELVQYGLMYGNHAEKHTFTKLATRFNILILLYSQRVGSCKTKTWSKDDIENGDIIARTAKLSILIAKPPLGKNLYILIYK